jgi:hypothetical protein
LIGAAVVVTRLAHQPDSRIRGELADEQSIHRVDLPGQPMVVSVTPGRD